MELTQGEINAAMWDDLLSKLPFIDREDVVIEGDGVTLYGLVSVSATQYQSIYFRPPNTYFDVRAIKGGNGWVYDYDEFFSYAPSRIAFELYDDGMIDYETLCEVLKA